MKANISTCHERGYFDTALKHLTPLEAILFLQKEYEKTEPLSMLIFEYRLQADLNEEEEEIILKAETLLEEKCSKLTKQLQDNFAALQKGKKHSV